MNMENEDIEDWGKMIIEKTRLNVEIATRKVAAAQAEKTKKEEDRISALSKKNKSKNKLPRSNIANNERQIIHSDIASFSEGLIKPTGVMPINLNGEGGFEKKYIKFLKEDKAYYLRHPRQADVKINKPGLGNKPMVYKETDLVKFFLMKSLTMAGYDIVINEYYYKGSIADIFGVVKGRAVEFEIKTSKSDFKNDFKKVIWNGKACNKHGMLSAGQTCIHKFYFVAPFGILDISDCPEHVGLIVYHIIDDVPRFKVIKQAPVLHKPNEHGYETKVYLSAGEWQGIAKRLAIRCSSLMNRYVDNKFKALLNDSIYEDSNTNDKAADSC